jgi:hypothetical protein
MILLWSNISQIFFIHISEAPEGVTFCLRPADDEIRKCFDVNFALRRQRSGFFLRDIWQVTHFIKGYENLKKF